MGSCLGKMRREPKEKTLETSEYASVGSRQQQISPAQHVRKKEEKGEIAASPTSTSTPTPTQVAASTPKPVVEKKEGKNGSTMLFESVLKSEGDLSSRMIQYQESWEAIATVIGIDVEDPALLAFSYEVCSADTSSEIQQLTITENAWNIYCASKNISSAAALKKQVPSWRSSLMSISSKKFRQIYEFAFTFIRDQSVRNMPIDDASMYVVY